MKTRNGFVSNSSSSSFICHGQKIGDIAKSMLKTVSEDLHKSTAKSLKLKLTKSLKDKRVIRGEIGICFPSCNYDTYMVQVGELVYVSTCNNYIWDVDGEHVPEDDHDIVKDKIESCDFIHIGSGRVHSSLRYDADIMDKNYPKHCPKCKSPAYDYVIIDGKNMCSNCYKGEIA